MIADIARRWYQRESQQGDAGVLEFTELRTGSRFAPDLKWYIPRQYQREDAMPKAAVFTMKLEPDLRDEFMAAAEASHRPASQVVREMMREFVKRQQDQRDHSDFLRRKIEVARTSAEEGRGRSNEAVEAEFAARRARIIDRA